MKSWLDFDKSAADIGPCARDHTCKRVTCSPPSPWRFSNQARTRLHPHSSTPSLHILCTYQNRRPRRVHHTDISVSLGRPPPRCNSQTYKDIRTKTFLCTRPGNHNRISMINHRRRCTSPPMVISSTFLTFPPGGSMVQQRSWACNSAKALFKQARTTSNKTCASLMRI